MIRRATRCAAVALPDSGGAYIQAARHPGGTLLSLYDKDRRSTRFYLASRDGNLSETRPGWTFQDGVVAAVDPRGRLAAWRWFGDRALRRYSNGELDATYPFSFLEAGYDIAFLQDGALVAAGGRNFKLYAEQAIPQRDLARLLKVDSIVSVDAAECIFALTRETRVMRLGAGGTLERAWEPGLHRPDTVRVSGECVWCADTVSGEALATSAEGQPIATVDCEDLGLSSFLGRTLVAHADGVASVVGYDDRGASWVSFG